MSKINVICKFVVTSMCGTSVSIKSTFFKVPVCTLSLSRVRAMCIGCMHLSAHASNQSYFVYTKRVTPSSSCMSVHVFINTCKFHLEIIIVIIWYMQKVISTTRLAMISCDDDFSFIWLYLSFRNAYRIPSLIVWEIKAYYLPLQEKWDRLWNDINNLS